MFRHKSFLSACLMLGLAALASVPAQAAVYSYHPKSRVYLGGGYSPFHPDTGYLECVDSEGVKAVDTAGAVKTTVKMIQIKTIEDFYKQVSFSASLAGSYMFYSGGGSVESFSEQAFHADSFTWLVLFESNYGRFVLKNPRLKPDLDHLSGAELARRCGPEVVTEATRAVSAFALFTVKNISRASREKFEASFHASAGMGFWSAEVDSSYKSLLATAMSTSNVEMVVDAIGGEGVTKLSQLLDESGGTSPSDPYAKFNNLPKVLAKYIETQTAANAAPVSFNTQSLDVFTSSAQPELSTFKASQVAELYTRYQTYSGVVSRIHDMLWGNEVELYNLTDAEQASFKGIYNTYSEGMNQLFAVAQTCFDSAQQERCVLPAETLTPVRWPEKKLDLSECQRLRSFAITSGLATDAEVAIAARRNFVPILDWSNPTQPKINGWGLCEKVLNDLI
jgi:hypothetical protein